MYADRLLSGDRRTALQWRAVYFTNPANGIQFPIWKLLCAVVITVAVLIGLVLWNWVTELHRSVNASTRTQLSGFLEMAAYTGFGWWLFNPESIYSFGLNWQTEYSRGSMAALVVVCFFMVAWPSSLWMKMSVAAFNRLSERNAPPMETATQFRNLRERAQLVGFLTAIGIASATLPMGAWRRVALAASPSPGDLFMFPPEWVMLFGLYWSFFLAAGYVPIHVAITRAGQSIRDSLVPPSPRGAQDFGDWQKRHKEIEAYLGLDANSTDSFKLALAVLSPLIMGVFSTMTGK